MGKFEQERLNFLFEVENIKAPLMDYIYPGVMLKVVTVLGSKDKNGAKRRFYEETKYSSNKYSNTNSLVSAQFRINSYLLLEYPNPNFSENNYGDMRYHGIVIRGYAIDDMVSRMNTFNKYLRNTFKDNNGSLTILSDKVTNMMVCPSSQTSIVFSPDIYKNNMTGRDEPGVRICLNNEFTFTISAETTWLEFIYRISRCDLSLMGMQMIQSYMSLLPGMAVSEIGKYNGTSRFKPYWGEDPDDIVNRSDSVAVNGRPTTQKEKINNFFNSL